MNRSRRFKFWMSGILAVVCLLLLNVLVWHLGQDPSGKFVIVGLFRYVLVAKDPVAPSREYRASRRVEAPVSSAAIRDSRLHPLARARRNSAIPAKPIVPSIPTAAPLPVVALPPPKTTVLEPIGYVEKADGQVEAVISMGENVQVVHEGDIIEDKFKVVKISSSSVELAENIAPSAEPPLRMEASQGGTQLAASKAEQTTLRVDSPEVSSPSVTLRYEAPHAAAILQPSAHQEVGYVERADGRVETIVADGEHVRLVRGSKSFANQFHPPALAQPGVEVANSPTPAIVPPDQSDPEYPAAQTSSSDQQKAGGPTLSASGTSPMNSSLGIPGFEGGMGAEQLGVAPPQPLAEYSESWLRMNKPQAVGPTLPALKSPPPPTTEGPQSAVSSLGYVEKASGEREAVVEALGRVYLVHEGELFAGKYRALQVTPSSVEIIEESKEPSPVPDEPKREH